MLRCSVAKADYGADLVAVLEVRFFLVTPKILLDAQIAYRRGHQLMPNYPNHITLQHTMLNAHMNRWNDHGFHEMERLSNKPFHVKVNINNFSCIFSVLFFSLVFQ